MNNPYVGLRAFEREDQEFFFGREREASILASLAIAERIVLLYAPSGAGKTSLINTSLLPRLEQRGFEALPVGRVSGQSEVRGQTSNVFVHNLLLSVQNSEQGAAADRLATMSLAEFLDGLVRDGDGFCYDETVTPAEILPRILIIDQFEEVLTTQPEDWRKRYDFFTQLSDAIQADPYLNVVLSIREDYVAALEPYAHLLPGNLRTRFYMQLMDEEAALKAVMGPARKQGRPFSQEAAEALVRNLRQASFQEADGSYTRVEGQFVEPVQLQVVCHQLWENLIKHELQHPPANDELGKSISERVLRELVGKSDLAGFVDVALAKFYEDVLTDVAKDQQGRTEYDLRYWCETRLITKAGTRAMVLQEKPLTAGLDTDIVVRLREKRLLRAERRGVNVWYELTHDRLIAPVLQSNEDWRRDKPLIELAWTWEGMGRPEGALLSGEELEKQWASDWQSLGELVREYMDASKDADAQRKKEEAQHLRDLETERQQRQLAEKRERDQRRLARLLAALSVAAILLIAASILAVLLIRDAAKARGSTMSLRLAEAASRNLDRDPELSLQLARYAASETYRVDRTVVAEAEDALHKALQVLLPGVTLSGHTGAVNGVAFSSDGTRLATASTDKTAKVWDAATGKELFTLEGHASAVLDVAFSPGGTRLATASADKTAKVWVANAGAMTTTLIGHKAAVNGVAFSPDGMLLATASADKTAILWDAATGEELCTLEGHDSYVNGVAFSPDGTRLATAGADKTTKVWDAETGKELFTLEGHASAVLDVAFSPDGARLATASLDRTAKVWDAKTGQELLTLTGHDGAVYGIAFSRDGTRMATASADGVAKLWSAATGRELSTLSDHGGAVLDIAFSRDGTHLATSSADTKAKLWDAEPVQPLILTGHSEAVNGVAFSPESEWLATASADKKAIVWDARSSAKLFTLTGHTGAVHSVAFSPEGEWLATASEDGTAKVWDAETGEELLTLSGHSSAVRDVAFSPDDSRLATTSADKTAIVWDAETGQELLTLTGHTGAVYSVAFSPDGEWLATASEDGTAKVWDAETGTQLLALEDHTGAVRDVAFSPDGSRLATASADKKAIVWDAETGQELLTLTGHTDAVYGVAFSPPHGTRLVTASEDGTVKVWDAETGRELLELKGRASAVRGVAFSPDGARLASAGTDKTARVYVMGVEELMALAGQLSVRDLSSDQCLAFFGEEGCPAGP